MSSFEINIKYNFKKCYEEEYDIKSRVSIVLNQVKKLRRVDEIFRDALKSAQQI